MQPSSAELLDEEDGTLALDDEPPTWASHNCRQLRAADDDEDESEADDELEPNCAAQLQ